MNNQSFSLKDYIEIIQRNASYTASQKQAIENLATDLSNIPQLAKNLKTILDTLMKEWDEDSLGEDITNDEVREAIQREFEINVTDEKAGEFLDAWKRFKMAFHQGDEDENSVHSGGKRKKSSKKGRKPKKSSKKGRKQKKSSKKTRKH